MGEQERNLVISLKYWIVVFSSLILLSSLCQCSTQNLLKAEKTGAIYVTSDPPGSAILLDHGLTQRTTPDTIFDVAEGEHVVSVMQPGYLSSPESLLVTVEEDQTSRADFVLLEVSKGSLKVTSSVDGATICIDNQPTVEVTPHVFFNTVPVGEHIVSVFREGYSNQEPTKEIVQISTGDTAEVDFVLTPAETGTEAGKIPPDFELEDDFGFWHRLHAYRGFVTMINFWATDCTPCMDELPYLQGIYTDYLADTLFIFGLNYWEGFDVIQRVRAEKQLTFTLLKDVDGGVKSDYGVSGTPVTIILDRGGKVHFYWQGFQHPNVALKFRDALDDLFGK